MLYTVVEKELLAELREEEEKEKNKESAVQYLFPLIVYSYIHLACVCLLSLRPVPRLLRAMRPFMMIIYYTKSLSLLLMLKMAAMLLLLVQI